MIFALSSKERFDDLVQRVAQRITVRCPPVVANNPERTVSQQRMEEVLEDSIAGALQPQPMGPIGFLRRTRLKSALKWELREIGYEEKFAELAAEKLIAQIARGGKQS